jgi:hypothetical protein
MLLAIFVTDLKKHGLFRDDLAISRVLFQGIEKRSPRLVFS